MAHALVQLSFLYALIRQICALKDKFLTEEESQLDRVRSDVINAMSDPPDPLSQANPYQRAVGRISLCLQGRMSPSKNLIAVRLLSDERWLVNALALCLGSCLTVALVFTGHCSRLEYWYSYCILFHFGIHSYRVLYRPVWLDTYPSLPTILSMFSAREADRASSQAKSSQAKPLE